MHHISLDLERLKLAFLPALITASLLPATSFAALKSEKIEDFVARPPMHIFGTKTAAPKGLEPKEIKTAYKLPDTGGKGTIAIVTAYHSPTLPQDIDAFDKKYNLPECNVANKCLEIHSMSPKPHQSTGWALETAMDTEWAHAIAPSAHILVVEADSSSGPSLLKAVDYARNQPGVVSVSMSWGGKEFKEETRSDAHFTSDHNIAFFAASGDNGFGASWPAASPNVISVGGTSLSFAKDDSLSSEKAWNGSGGGISTFEDEPGFQKSYSIAKAKGKRAIPDVAFHADPKTGYSVYHDKGWYVVGGTSAGAPEWAAIRALDDGQIASSSIAYLTQLYQDKAGTNHASFFRDITSGSNGDCGYYCDARRHYDYVTGLGSPVTYKF